MSLNLRWRPRARADLLETYATIVLDKPSAAERWLTTMEDHAALLIHHPRLGVKRPELATSARILPVGNYFIVYKTHPDTESGAINEVEIVRVVHGYRDLSRLF